MFVIDECQSQSSLLYLINSIIGPVVKGRNGIIMLAGTGPLSGGTYWEDCITDGTWSVLAFSLASFNSSKASISLSMASNLVSSMS